MTSEEKRAAPRIECEVPVRIIRPRDFPEIQMLDASGTGIRLRIDVESLGLKPPVDLGRIASALKERLGKEFVVEFNPQRLGRLIVRHLRVARIGRYRRKAGSVELGCRLRQPFSSEEAAAIGLALKIPKDVARTEGQGAYGEQAADEEAENSAETATLDALGALVIPIRKENPQPLFAGVESLSAEGASLRIQGLVLSEAAGTAVPVAVATARVQDALRDQATMQLSLDENLVWSGPVRIEGVEVLEAESDLLLFVAFFGRLSPAACETLGLRAA